MNRISARTAVLALLAAFLPLGTAAAQQPAILQGKVLDAATGEPLIGAQVVLAGTDRGTVTDVDGRYRLDVEPGTASIDVQYLGYAGKTVTGIRIEAGRTTFQDVALEPEAVQAEGIRVVISAEEERGSVIGALAHQRRATNVVSGVSAEEISRAPDSNAADAVKRVTGTSIVGDKYVYVRGLGERLRGGPGSADLAALRQEVEVLREALQDSRGDVTALEERIDFAERLLAQHREAGRLPGK